MPRLLVVNPEGIREIISIDDSGSYYDQSKVVWDERINGPMPDNACPSMVVVDGSLVVDDSILAATIAKQLDDRKSQAIIDVDCDSDDVVNDVIGRRDTEYLMAEKQAQDFIAAGYNGDTYPYVSSWAAAKNATESWAADNIIDTANNWRLVQSDMRAKRLKTKEDVRNALTVDDIDILVNTWKSYISSVKNSLGVK